MADVVELSGRHAATYWLFSHLEGLRHVAIPEAALFDNEGVLESWLFANAQHKNKNQSECQVARRGLLETNVMRLEAHFQDLAKAKQSEVVAVKICDVPVHLTETSLDELVRTLCAREIAMNAPDPDLSIPREFADSDGAGGSFCIQEFVPPSNSNYIVAHFRHAATLSSSLKSANNDEADDEETCRTASNRKTENNFGLHAGLFSFSTRPWSLENQYKSQDAAEGTRSYNDEDLVDTKLQARVQELLQCVITHLHMFFGLRSLELTVEFTHEQSFDRLYLVSAQRIQVQQISHTRDVNGQQQQPGLSILKTRLRPGAKRIKQSSEFSSNNLMKSDELDSEPLMPISKYQQQQTPSPTHVNYRVCRQCRSNTDVDLAKEIMRKQTMLRGVLAKYQSVQEQHAVTHRYNQELQELLEHQKRTIHELQRELDRVRSAFQEKDVQALELKLENSGLQVQLVNTVEELQVVNLRVELAEQRVLQAEALQKQNSPLGRENEDTRQTIRQWEQRDTHLEQQLGQLQHELERSQQTLRKLQTKYEEVRADRDELRFQRRFVCRKLVDIKDPGVSPPQRIAGGYRSYPTPSVANVRDVVKWLVDYDAKRVLIEAQKKSVGKRLRLKLELMRVLESPKKRKSTLPATTCSAASSPSPRRRSRSPSKWSPTVRSKSRVTAALEPEAGVSSLSASPAQRPCRQDGSTVLEMTLVDEALARREQRKLSQDQQTNSTRGHVW